uniref:MGA conserved domain-containing protein n=1 Tax=Anopheles maculatus TaxID=74869 RepID=A0A182SKW6_9DIPT
MFYPVCAVTDSHSSAGFANTHTSSRRKCCPHHSATSALDPKAFRLVGAPSPDCCTSVHGAKDDSPVAFSNRLRICRLMYKPLPHGSCKLDPRHYRNRRLALIKKRAIKVTQASAARRAIPQYFQKRIRHKLLAKKSAAPQADCATERDPAELPDTGAQKEGEFCDKTNPVREAIPITPDAPSHIDPDSVESRALATVPTPRATVLDRADALNTIKEYYSIQSAIRLLLSMLQERMEEVETMQKKRILPDVKAEIMETAATVIANDDDVVPSSDVTENDSKAPLVKTEPNDGTPEQTVKDFDPDKENNVPLASTLESMSPVTVALNRVHSTPSKEDSKEDARPTYSFLETSKSDILDPSYTCDIELEPLENRKNRSIVDSLLNKFNLSPPVKAVVPYAFADGTMDGADGRRSLRDRTKIAARPRYSEIPEEPRKMRVSKVFGKLHKTLNIELDCTNSNSSTEFYGFDEGEVVKLDKPSLPGLLPTPIVKKSQPYAPFLTYGSCIEAQQAKGETETETRSDLFREEGLISFGSVPPRLECPQRPTDMVRPRTVAQKRILVQRENDIRYVMIDNESKIFQFLKKRSQNIDAALDFCRMKELQDQQIPFTRSTWRALGWLRSEKGRYFFQKMTIDNRTIKLSGCRGNHRLQYVTRNMLYSSPVIASRGHRYHYVINCRCPKYPQGITINISQGNAAQRKANETHSQSERQTLPIDNSKYLFRGSSNNADYQSKRSYPGTKPGPLSSKCLLPVPDDDPCLGPLEIFKMPKVELEVFPKLNRPLDGYVKPYLKMILPHDDITENWARFAVSTLTAAPGEGTEEHGTKGKDDHEERSFVFELPYQNDQRRMLVRRRLMACHGAPMNVDVERFTKLMDEKLTFRKTIDEALARGERDQLDPDELVCADVLSDLTDSVAISLAEDVFVKDDPDIEYVKKREEMRALPTEPKMVPIKTETADSAAGEKTTPIPSPSAVAAQNELVSDVDSVGSINGTGSECSKTTDPAKLKLLREMKRLNATIIEGPSDPAPGSTEPGRQQRCDPQYCSQGCICDVLCSSQAVSVANIHRKQHCGRIDCVFECVCGFAEKSNQTLQATKVDQGEEEESVAELSIAEQRYLREKATARLAKEEREFTPTVILTKNTTVLVQNKESECRRLKKKPKKYDDYYNDQSVQCLLNGGSVKDVSGYISKPPPNAKPLTQLERMRHAHVLLNKLPHLEDVEPLCMVHDLYRCFCGGKATQGKPFSFTEENCIPIPPKSSVTSDVAPSMELVPAAGRMTKGGGGQSSTKNRTKEQEAIEYSIDATSAPLVNVRK